VAVQKFTSAQRGMDRGLRRALRALDPWGGEGVAAIGAARRCGDVDLPHPGPVRAGRHAGAGPMV